MMVPTGKLAILPSVARALPLLLATAVVHIHAEASWEGYLAYDLLGGGDGDGCNEADFQERGATIALTAMEFNTLCETDVLEPPGADAVTIHTKFVVDSCGSPPDSDAAADASLPTDAGYISFYNCADASCSSCDADVSVVGYASVDDMSELNACFGWHLTYKSNQTDGLSVLNAQKEYQRWSSNATLPEIEAYWSVFTENSCFGEMLAKGADPAETTGTASTAAPETATTATTTPATATPASATPSSASFTVAFGVLSIPTAVLVGITLL